MLECILKTNGLVVSHENMFTIKRILVSKNLKVLRQGLPIPLEEKLPMKIFV